MLPRWLQLAAATLAVLGLGVGSPAVLAADTAPPPTPDLLKAEQTGTLPGGSGGHFAYYRFEYPAGWPMRLELYPWTEDKNVLQYVGLRVYGPQTNRVYAEAKLVEGVWDQTADLFEPTAGEYVVQIYNYYPDRNWALGFTLLAPNLPPQPGGDPVPTPMPGSVGHVAIPIEGVEHGRLERSDGIGQFRYYSFATGRGRNVTLNLQINPDRGDVLTAAGYKVYGPQAGRVYLESEGQARRTPNETGTLWIDQDGLYVVQVYNYSRDVPIDYELWIDNPD